MKCRQDFVTNSSSSSYIFGELNGNNYSVEILYRQLYIWIMELLNISKEIDFSLSNKDKDLFNKLVEFREKSYKSYYSDSYDLDDELDKLRNDFDGLYFMEFIQNELLIRNINLDIQDFIDFYLNEYADLNKFSSFLSYKTYDEYLLSDNRNNRDFVFTIVDFKDKDLKNKYDVEEIVSWYCYDDLDDDEYFNNHSDDYYHKLAHKYLGEVAIFSSEGYIPRILMNLFEINTKYHCHHMG